MHQRLYLFHPIAGGYLCITDSICPIRAHSFNFANLLLELFCLTARLRAIPMVAHSAARTFIYWFARLWMFTSTDAASRVCTCRARIFIYTTFVFREQLLIFVFPANVTFALSLFACAGILTCNTGGMQMALIVFFDLLYIFVLKTNVTGARP